MSDPVTVGSVIGKILVGVGSKLLPDVLKETWEKALSKWEEKDYQKAADRYAKHLLELHGYIHVIALNKRMRLSSAYTDVNVLSRITTDYPAPKEFAEAVYLDKAKFGDITEGGERKDGLDLIRKYNKHFILGKPGAGKTTFLRYLLQEAIHGRLFQDEGKQVIPIYVELNKFSESDLSLIDYMAEQFDICQFPNAKPFIEVILSENKAFILFDGLDEVGEQNRHDVITQISKLSDKYTDCHFVVTCRIAATDYAFQRHGYTYIEMADFSGMQITKFVKNWFRTSGEEIKSNEFLNEFNKSENKRLRELAKTPLLLAMMCLLYDVHQAFPERHVEVYDQAIDALLYKWWGERGIKHEEIYRNLDLGRKKQMFAKIAAKNFEKDRFLFPQDHLQTEIVEYLRKIPPENTYESIDGQTVLKAIEMQHGIYIERANGFYSYNHLSFQEYFTAFYIHEHALQGSLEELIKHHWQEDRWREVFLRTTEKMANADKFFEIFQNTLDEYVTNNERIQRFIIFTNSFNQLNFPSPPLLHKSLLNSIIVILSTSYAYNLVEAIKFFFFQRRLFNREMNEYKDECISNLERTLSFDTDINYTIKHIQEIASTFSVDFSNDFNSNYINTQNRDTDHTKIIECYLKLGESITLVQALDQAIAFKYDQDLGLTWTYPLDQALNLDFTLIRTLALVHTFINTLSEGFDLNLCQQISVYINQVNRVAKDNGYSEIHKELDGLIRDIPSEEYLPQPVWRDDDGWDDGYGGSLTLKRDLSKKWKKFADLLESVFRNHRPVHEYEFKKGEAASLGTYLKGVKLFLDCLEVAYVEDREGIKNRLFRVPEEGKQV